MLIIFFSLYAHYTSIQLYVCFQEFHYTDNLRRVRYNQLPFGALGICVSGHWLVVTFDLQVSTPAFRLYRLPDLTPIQDLNYSQVYQPRCSSDGRVYVPALYMLTELDITAQGNLTVLRNITTGGWDWITAVGLGPQTGQLCIGAISRLTLIPVVYIIHLASGNITTTLTVPDQIGCFPITVSALSTGQILLTSLHIHPYAVSTLYQTISHQPRTLRNSTQEVYISVAYRGNFLVIGGGIQSGIDVLDGQGHVVHTVEDDYGFITEDLAVWQDSLLVMDFHGGLLWLSPV